MTVFFPGPGVRITHEVVETLTPLHRSYRICELDLPHVSHEAALDVAVASPTARVCSSLMTAVAALIATADSGILHDVSGTTVATGVTVAAGVFAIRGWWLWRQPRTLWAYHRGQRVALFTTRDRLVFGMVKRALLRAMEYETSY